MTEGMQYIEIYMKLLMRGLQNTMINFVMMFKFEADTFRLKITWQMQSKYFISTFLADFTGRI
jgi:hypothetical protein